MWILVRPPAYTSILADAFTLLTANMWGFPTPSTTSPALWTPIRHPMCPFDCDSNYSELASASARLSTQSHKTTVTSDASYKLWGPRLLMVLSNLATKSRVPTILPFELQLFARMAPRTQESNILVISGLL